MDLVHAIHQRRTVHAFTDAPVDPDIVARALAAAHMAPCHKLTWPWRFVVVGPQTRRALLPTALELAARKNARCDGDPTNLPPKLVAKVTGKICDPGALVAVVLRKSDDPFTAREDYAATACAIQNMMLVATDAGLGSKWGTGGITRAAETARLLGVDTETEEIVGFIFMGHPARTPTVDRPPVADHTRHLP